MKTPLKDGGVLIRAMLREQWHLEVTTLRFIPFGNSAYSYRVETQQNRRYYLKIVDLRTSVGPRIAAHLNFSLPLQHLVAQRHLPEVTAPLPQPTSNGDLYGTYEPFLFALYTFIHGDTLADAYPMTPALVQQIGRAVAALHTIKIPEALQERSPQDSLTAP